MAVSEPREPRPDDDVVDDGQGRPAQGATETLALTLATAGGVGFAPVAPGTWGSALAIPIFVLLSPIEEGSGGGFLWAITWLGLLAVGVWAAEVCEPLFGCKDDGRIVWDEVVGQLLALAPLLVWPQPGRAGIAALVTGFVLFRCFDIAKPGPVGWAERSFQGGMGVMMDDVIAGALAAGLLAVAIWTGMFGWL